MIAQLDGRGRGIIAERTYNPGDIVIVEEPYAFVVSERYAGVACGYCGRQVDHPMLALSPEDNTRYCCEKCITLDYPVHALEATPMAGLISTGVSGRGMDAMKLVIRIGAQRKHENNLKTVPVTNVRNGRENTYNHIRLMEANTSSCSSSAARDVTSTAKELAKLSSVLSLPATEAEFLLYVIQCNAHTIVSNHDDDGAAVGLGLFPMTSMMNHSCRPNCLHQFVFETGRPPRLLMKAITHVAVGEEMLYSYVPLYQSTPARKQQLYSAYSFECQCSRCEMQEDGLIDEIITDLGALDDLEVNSGLGESLILPSQIPSQTPIQIPSQSPSHMRSQTPTLDKGLIEQTITQLILALQPNHNHNLETNPSPNSNTNSNSNSTNCSPESSPWLHAGWINMLAFLQSPEMARFPHPAHRLLFQCYLSVLRYVSRLPQPQSSVSKTDTNISTSPESDPGTSPGTSADSDLTSMLHTACVYGLLALGCMKTFIHEPQPEIGIS